MKPIPLKALAKLLSIHHEDQTLIQGVAIDSRKVKAGDLFFALSGARVDGHTFFQEAVSKGAVGAVVREDYRGDTFNVPLIYVPDVLAALQEIARKSLQHRSSKVIAITGSLGKTTTKEFTSTLLRSSYRIFSSPLSYNSQATVPLSILMADESAEYLILEMGMSQKGEIKKLISMAPPHISLITTVAVQHANNFPDGLAGISEEKGVIFSHPQTELGILHYDIAHFDQVAKMGTCPKKTFSLTNKEADYFLEFISEGVRILTNGKEIYEIPLVFPNKAHYQNFLAALTIARAVNIPWPLISEASANLKVPPMRFERIEKQGITFINDAYNANPDSMKAAFENLPKPAAGGKVIAVISEMDALGMYSEEGHMMVAEIALKYIDLLFCLGSRCEAICKIWQRENRPCELFTSRDEMQEALKKSVKPGDVVLLKGARTHALEEILNEYQ